VGALAAAGQLALGWVLARVARRAEQREHD